MTIEEESLLDTLTLGSRIWPHLICVLTGKEVPTFPSLSNVPQWPNATGSTSIQSWSTEYGGKVYTVNLDGKWRLFNRAYLHVE